MIHLDERTILVTGGCGFIGRRLVRLLLADAACRVVNLDLLTYAATPLTFADSAIEQRYHFVHGDIADAELVRGLIERNRPRAVVNLAAESHVDRSVDSPDRFIQTNTLGAAQLLKASLEYWERLGPPDRTRFRFLQTSTDEVHGSLNATGRFDERSPYDPSSPYSASKAAADHLVRAYHRTYGLPTLIGICCNNYGPRQHPEKLVPLMILSALARRPLPVYGDGAQVRDWIHAADHARALQAILRGGRPGETYPIGAECELTNLQMVKRICRAVDQAVPQTNQPPPEELIQFVADRPGHDFRYAIDPGKIRTELGWRPQVEFTAGLQATVAWYADNSEWASQMLCGEPPGQRLGLRRSADSDSPQAD